MFWLLVLGASLILWARLNCSNSKACSFLSRYSSSWCSISFSWICFGASQQSQLLYSVAILSLIKLEILGDFWSVKSLGAFLFQGYSFGVPFARLVAASAIATALHIKTLFHWPKKSADEEIGQKRPKGITHAVASTTFSRLPRLAEKHTHIIDQRNIVPVTRPAIPVSPAIWI